MKGIILAGGRSTRLFPATIPFCKQLIPIFDKPMVYYPLSVLMLSNIRDILIISSKEDLPRFYKLFKDGSELGLNISYASQDKPEGIAQAFLIGKDFIKNDPVALILGDNFFYGHDLTNVLYKSSKLKVGANIFGYYVNDPKRYGVVSFNENKEVLDIEEKPKHPKSSFAIPGCIFYDNQVVSIASSLKPSKRGELEITDVNKVYLEKKLLKVELLGRGYSWIDTGAFEDLLKASLFVSMTQERQGIKIACIEEISYRMGFIGKNQFLNIAKRYSHNEYGKYLLRCLEMDIM